MIRLLEPPTLTLNQLKQTQGAASCGIRKQRSVGLPVCCSMQGTAAGSRLDSPLLDRPRKRSTACGRGKEAAAACKGCGLQLRAAARAHTCLCGGVSVSTVPVCCAAVALQEGTALGHIGVAEATTGWLLWPLLIPGSHLPADLMAKALATQY